MRRPSFAKIADQSKTKLYLIHVLESASIKNRDIVTHYQSGEEMLTSAAYEGTVKTVIMQNYARLLKEYDNCEIKVVSGFPWHEIRRYSREIKSDLIAMGSHTKEKQGKWYTGSAVERVAFRSNCPVIVISDPKSLMPLFI